MLREPIATRRRRIAGNAAVAVLASVAAFAAWASQPSTSSLQDAPAAHGEMRVKVVPDTYVGEVRIPAPAYPKAAADAGISGKVVLIVDVAADGTVANVEVEKSEPAGVFDANALAAVRKWLFKPATKDGKPVGGRIRVPIEFRKD